MYVLYWCISYFVEATISWYWFLKFKINNNNKYNVIILILKGNVTVQY